MKTLVPRTSINQRVVIEFDFLLANNWSVQKDAIAFISFPAYFTDLLQYSIKRFNFLNKN